ncbi:MAG: ABC transporter permease [Candidatus Atribacteria bacterium]|nr:ABC transporter permease [Candidatus Atribacteria bacterium]
MFDHYVKHSRTTILFVMMLGAFIVMSIFLPDKFLSLSNFQSIASQIPEFGFLAIAIMLAMLTGGIDLSIISTANLAGVGAALILTRQLGDYGEAYIIFLAIISAIGISLLCGFINGLLIAYIKVPAILATLGTMSIFSGIAIVITKGYGIQGFPEKFLYIGSGTLFAVPMPMVIFIVCILLMSLILNRTSFGFNLYMLGSNPTAARFSGINNRGILIRTYVLSGLCAGLASIIMISRVNSIRPGYGSAYLLQAILVCVLGGVDPSGGYGNISGLVMGIIVLQILQSGFNILSFSPFFKNVVWGLMLIIVMILNFYSSRYTQKVRSKLKVE